MSVFTDTELRFLEAISKLVYCNPFLPERIGNEMAALGSEFVDSEHPWNVDPVSADLHVNVIRLMEKGEWLLWITW